MPAYAYLRKSVQRQSDPTNSPEAQEHAVRAMATRYGDSEGLVILSDWDVSGRLGRDKRPGYDALWQAIETGRCSCVYSYSMSRLARSVTELLRLFEHCGARHIPIRLEKDVVDTATASGRLVAGIIAQVAAFEADVQAERMHSALAAKAARGERIGTVRFYGDHVEDDPQAVLAAFRKANSFSGAAKILNSLAVPRRSSRKAWWPSSVAVVVRRLDPSLPAFRPSKGVPAGGSDFTLARLLTCPTCGTLLSGMLDRGRVRYACRLGNALPHPRITIAESRLLPAIILEVSHLRTPDQVEVIAGDDDKRAALNARRLRIIDLFESGHIDRSDRERRLLAVTDALGRLDARRSILTVPEVDWSWSPKALGVVLRALFERVDLDPETFQPVAYTWTVPEWRAP